MKKMKFLSAAGACAAVLAFAAPASATAVLLTSFEGTIDSGTNYEYVSATQPYSTVNVPLGSVTTADITYSGGSGIQANGSAWGFADAPNGTQTAFIQSYNDVGGSISIALNGLTAGQEYSVSFDLAARPYGGADPLTVSAGNSSGMFTITNTAWSTHSIDFMAPESGTADLKFLGSTLDGDSSVGLDAVSIAAVPEPATWAMMLLGFGMIGFASRRRQRAVRVSYVA